MVSVRLISSDMEDPDISLSGAGCKTSPTQPVTQKPDYSLLNVGFRPHVVLLVSIQQAGSGPGVHLLVGACSKMLVHLGEDVPNRDCGAETLNNNWCSRERSTNGHGRGGWGRRGLIEGASRRDSSPHIQSRRRGGLRQNVVNQWCWGVLQHRVDLNTATGHGWKGDPGVWGTCVIERWGPLRPVKGIGRQERHLCGRRVLES